MKETALTAAGRRYADAHATHYETKDSHEALMAYKGIVIEYPDSIEADYSRSQIQNIVRNAVPRQVLYDAELNLALKYTDTMD